MDETNTNDKVISRIIEVEMKQSYLDYSMSVIVGRALPDVRDGLKPVHRRILFGMHQLGMFHNKPFKKSARIVGEILGKYHPHGDLSVYDALVRMVQPFSLRYPLIQGQGNFGSVDGDRAAAMRYCITGDSLILTNKGILPIKEISKKQESKINLQILSYKGKKNKASKFFDSGKHKIISVETNLGYGIKGSYNHPLMCLNLRNGIPSIEWKLIENISKKDVVLINRNYSLFAKTNFDLKSFKPKKCNKSKKIGLPNLMNKELAFLLGAIVSEGFFHQNKIYFSNSDINFYNQVKDVIYSNFEGIQLYERKIAGNCLELNIYHKQAVEFLKNIGLSDKKSNEKGIPFSVFQSKKEIIAEFLKSLFEGGGSVSLKTDKRHNGKSIELNYNSKSKKLIHQLKMVLLNFGIVTAKPYLDKRNNCYKLIISGYDSIKKFEEQIGFYSERKKQILSKINSINSNRMSKTDFIPYLNDYLRKKYNSSFIKKNNFDRYNNLKKNYNQLISLIDSFDKKMIDFFINHNYFFDKVKSIKKSRKLEKVYSIKVDSNCHSFIANGFVNHNTEARLSKLSEESLQDIEKETVKFSPNFDGSLEEPVFLPSKVPNLLINGSSGIAVGMATNIPPHNLNEINDAIIHLIDNPEADEELLEIVKGPDFPTAGMIIGKKGIRDAYKTGRGKIKIRAKVKLEERKIIITEIPYMVNKATLLEEIADLVRNKKLIGISDIRDESSRNEIRAIIYLKKDANPDIILNQLYKHTRMQQTFGIIMLALVDNEPKVLKLKSVLQHYISHRQLMIRKRTEYDLRKSEKRAHILEGLIIALNNIDKSVELIKKSKSAQEAKGALISAFELSVEQAQAILDMKLQKLTGLEQEKIRQEQDNLIKLISELKEILSDENKILGIIKDELNELKEKYGDARRTEITEEEIKSFEMEELIKPENMVITISHSGYIKRQPVTTYRAQKRGGKGIIGATAKEEDFIEELFIANTHSYMLFFTNKGKVHWLKVYEISEGGRQARGKSIVNLLRLEEGEKVTAYVPVKEFKDGFLVMATKKGTIKKTALEEFSRPRKGGIIAISLKNNDELIHVCKTTGEDQLIIATRNGIAVRFSEKDVRSMGRSASGVRGIRLKQDDYVIGMVLAKDDRALLTVTEKGYGKKTVITNYRLISRGGSGVINIKCTDKNGKVAAIKSVTDKDELILISKKGIIIRVAVKDISTIGRATQGVRIMRLSEGDRVVSIARVIKE